MSERIAFIPARGGSKRMPRKNVIPFRGRPMIEWTIKAAQRSNLFNEIVVSTDDDEIAAIGERQDAIIDRRAKELASDHASIVNVVDEFLARKQMSVGHCCVLIPNCPLRSADDIRGAYRRFCDTQASATMSVVDYDWRRPQWALRNDDVWLRTTWQKQPGPLDRPERFVCPTGAVRWIDVKHFREQPVAYPERLSGFTMPWWRGIDIDEPQDLNLAKLVAFGLDRGFAFAEV